MKKKTFFIFLVSLLVFSGLATAVLAQQEGGVFDALLGPFGRLDQVYGKFSFFIDTVIYLIIFLGLSKFVLGKRFGKEGRAVTVGVGVVLALSLALFEARTGFNIASFGPVAALILLALMGYSVWVGIKSLEIEGVDNLTMSAIAYLLVYFGILMAVPGAAVWINTRVPVIGALLALLALGFTIYIIYKMGAFIAALVGAGKPTVGKAPEEGGKEVAGLTPADERDAKKQRTTAKRGINYAHVLEDIHGKIIKSIANARRNIVKAKQPAELKAGLMRDVKEIINKEEEFRKVLYKVGVMAKRLWEAKAVGNEKIKNLENLTLKIFRDMKGHEEEIDKLLRAILNETKKHEIDAKAAVNALNVIDKHKEDVKDLLDKIRVDFDQVNDMLAELIAAHE
jgi:hypothetical protein